MLMRAIVFSVMSALCRDPSRLLLVVRYFLCCSWWRPRECGPREDHDIRLQICDVHRKVFAFLGKGGIVPR
jgi:hypothetical protein